MPAASVSCSTEVLRIPTVTARRRPSASRLCRMRAFFSWEKAIRVSLPPWF